MNETYEIIGYQYGTFNGTNGEAVQYANLFCVQDFKGEANQNYCFDGKKAFIFKCVNAAVLKDAEIGRSAKLYFNEYKKVQLIVIA